MSFYSMKNVNRVMTQWLKNAIEEIEDVHGLSKICAFFSFPVKSGQLIVKNLSIKK